MDEQVLLRDVHSWGTNISTLGGDFSSRALEKAKQEAARAYAAGYSVEQAFQAARHVFYQSLETSRPHAI